MTTGGTQGWRTALVAALTLTCTAATLYGRPIAVSLILDHSGSMNNNDPNDVRISAARLFTDLMLDGSDRGSAIGFDDHSVTQCSMTRSMRTLRGAFSSSGFQGLTSYAPALQLGYDELASAAAAGVADSFKAAVLFSDGRPQDSYVAQVEAFVGMGWRIYPIAFGDADDTVMQGIAAATGGQYFRVTTENMQQTMLNVVSLIRRENPPPMDEDQISEGEHVTHEYDLPGDTIIDWVKFAAIWEFGSQIDFYVVSPNGRTYRSDFSGGNYGVYTIDSPPSGIWTIHLIGVHSADGQIDVSYGKTVTTSERGSITVTASPSGALCRFGTSGSWTPTPYTYAGLNPAQYTVYCSKAGFVTASQVLQLSAGQKLQHHFSLSQATGQIDVYAQPAGCECRLDNVTWLAVDNPTVFTSLPAGSHTVGCRKSGYHSDSKSVYVSTVATTPVSFSLRQVGRISVGQPTSNANWERGTAQNVQWTSEGITGNVRVDLYRGGTLDTPLAASVPASTEGYAWTIPTTRNTGNDYAVKVTSLADGSVYGWSAAFRITDTRLSIGGIDVTAETIWETSAGSDVWRAFGNVVIEDLVRCSGDITVDRHELIIAGNCRLWVGPLPDGIVPETTLWDGGFQFSVNGTIMTIGQDFFSSTGAQFYLTGLPVRIRTVRFSERNDIMGLEIGGSLGYPEDIILPAQRGQGAAANAFIDFASQGRYLRIDRTGISFDASVNFPDMKLGTWGLSDNVMELRYREWDPDSETYSDSLQIATVLSSPAHFDVEAGMAWRDGRLDFIAVGADFNDPGRPILYTPAGVPVIFLQRVHGELYDLAAGPPPWGFRIGEIDQGSGLLTSGLDLTVGPEFEGHYTLKGGLAMDISSSGRFWGSGQLFVFSDEFEIARGDVYIARDYGVYVGAKLGWTFDTPLIDASIEATGKMHHDRQNVLRGQLSGKVMAELPWPWGETVASGNIFMKLADPDADGIPDKYLVAWLQLQELQMSLQYDFIARSLKCPANMDLVESVSFPTSVARSALPANGLAGDRVLTNVVLNVPGQYVFILRTAADTTGFEIEQPGGQRVSPDSSGVGYLAQAGKGAFYVLDVHQAQLGTWNVIVPNAFVQSGAQVEVRLIRSVPALTSVAVADVGSGDYRVTWQDGDSPNGLVSVLYSVDGTLSRGCTVAEVSSSDGENGITWSTTNIASGLYAVLVTLEQDGQPPAIVVAATRVSVANPLAPAAPASVVLSGTNGMLSVRWTPVPDALGYTVEYRDMSRPDLEPGAISKEDGIPHFAISGLPPGRDYQVRVRAYSEDGASSLWAGWHSVLLETSFGANSAPLLSSLYPVAQVGVAYSNAVIASDADGNPIRFSLLDGPTGCTMNASGQIEWTPTEDQIGVTAIDVLADDGYPGGTNSRVFSVMVLHADAPASMSAAVPVLLNATNLTVETWGEAFAHTFGATVPAGSHVVFQAAGLPAGAIFVDNGDGTATLRWTPTRSDVGSHGPVTVTCTSGYAADSVPLTLAVKDLKAMITAPGGESSVHGVVDIVGTCWATNDFAGGLIEIAPLGGEYQLLQGGFVDSTVIDGVLLSGFDTRRFADGQYSVRIRAMDYWDGSYAERAHPIRIDNTPPRLKKTLAIANMLTGPDLCEPGAEVGVYGSANEPVKPVDWSLTQNGKEVIGAWAVQSPVTERRGWPTAVAVNEKLFLMNDTTPTASVEILDTSQPMETWVGGPSLNMPRVAVRVVAVRNRLYVVGGSNGSETLTGVEILDTANLTAGWQGGPSLNMARRNHALCVVGERVYAIAGKGGTGDMLSSVEVLDTRDLTAGWQVLPSLSVARWLHTSEVVNGRIYAIAGYGSDGRLLSSVEEFDTANSSPIWRAAPSLRHPRANYTSLALDGRVYVIGGQELVVDALNTVEVLDTERLSLGWQASAPLQLGRFHHSATIIGRRIVVSGGYYHYTAPVTSQVEVFDAANPSAGWCAFPPMNRSRVKHATAAVNGRIYAIGGDADSFVGVETLTLCNFVDGRPGYSDIFGGRLSAMAALETNSPFRLALRLSDLAGNTTDWLPSNDMRVHELAPDYVVSPSLRASVCPTGGVFDLTGVLTDPAGLLDSVDWSRDGMTWYPCDSILPDWRGACWHANIPSPFLLMEIQVKCSDKFGQVHGPVSWSYRNVSRLPLASITAPVGAVWNTAPEVRVEGNVQNRIGQTQFGWRLDVARGDGSAGQWVSLVEGATTEVTQGLLCSWPSPSIQDLYTLRLTASNDYGAVETTRRVWYSNESPPDYDLDGLSDPWEWEIVTASDTDSIWSVDDVLPLGDFDGDGLLNRQEEIAGTDPVDPHSTLELSIRNAVTPSNRVVVSWETVAGRYYSLKTVERLQSGEPWENVANFGPRIGTGFTMSYTNLVPQSRLLYRVILQRGE